MTVPLERDDGSADVGDKWIPGPVDANGIVDKTAVDEGMAYSDTYELEEGILSDEEKWRAQYGQVIESETDLVSEFPVVDMWDWEMKNSEGSYIETPSSPGASCTQEAASEALEMSFGFGSYARKLLKIQKHGLKAGRRAWQFDQGPVGTLFNQLETLKVQAWDGLVETDKDIAHLPMHYFSAYHSIERV
ncbi:hypothetical protein AHAS_Ahas18G0217700 [Arachis hypogaea]